MKFLRILFLGILCAFASNSFAQLNIGTVDPGPYTPGSTIAATFSTDQSSCVAQGNIFELYLSDATGSFATETRIGTYNGFYSTFVNGIIPTGTPAGTGYKLRIKSTTPVLTSTESNSFTIVAGVALEANINSITISASHPEAFGLCSGRSNQNFAFTNVSTPGSTVTSTLKNEITGTTSPIISYDVANKQFTADLAHYTIITKAVKDGTVSTKANFLINNDVKNAFRTGNNDVKCLPGAALLFSVDISSDGIGNNFPGNTYVLNWGDGIINTYTICDIINSGQTVQHLYNETSCGKSVDLNGIREYNVFAINITVESPFCGRIGAPLSTTARVGTGPENRIEAPTIGCVGSEITFRNVSLLGENPRTTANGCEPNRVTYNWYVDGELEAANMPRSFNLNFTFTTNGWHDVRIVSMTDGPCNDNDETVRICIQNKPQPSFTFGNVTTFCEPKPAFKVTNTSIIDTSCDPIVNYTWNVSPAVTYANGTNQNSPEPEFDFLDAGIYTVTLEVSNSSCEAVITAPQTIIVNAVPTANLSPNASLCNLGIYNFNATTLEPTRAILEGTFRDEPTTYTWTVTGGAYNFIDPPNTKYPRIEFLDYTTYTVKVVHTNSCGTIEDSQVLTFIQSPVVNAGTYGAICYDTQNIQLNGSITNDPSATVTSITWSGGNGVFSPNANDMNAVYTPTAAERTSGSVNLILTVTTSLTECSQITAYTTITIKPEVTVDSAPSKSICTGTAVNYTPTSATAGAIFAWTVLSATNATGYTNSGTGAITDVITNTNTTANATVTYLITPTGNGCTGTPFTLNVTVVPQSVGGTTTGTTTVCIGSNSGQITLADHVGSVIRWESSTDGGITYPNIINNATTTLTYSNLSATTYYRAIVQSGTCAEIASTPSIISINPATTTAFAGVDQVLCNTTTTVLAANQPNANETALWTVEPANPSITFTDATQYNTTVNGLSAGQTYTFRWTITGLSPCPPSSDVVTVNNLSALLNNEIESTTTTYCTGQLITLTGSTPTGGDNTYTYIWQSSLTGAAPWANIASQTGKDLNVTVNATQFYRRIATSGTCSSESNLINITALPPIAGNSITSSQTPICENTTPNQLIGSQPSGGDGTSYTYTWEQSIDEITWEEITGAIAQNYQPGNLSQTTSYRRVVSTTTCSGLQNNTSNVFKVTVNPNAKAEFIPGNTLGCVPFNLGAANIKAVAYPDRNAIYIWYADGIEIGRGIDFPSNYSINTPNTDVKIKLVVTSSLGCLQSETSEITYSTRDNVAASFQASATNGCGPTMISFTNTSPLQTGATFEWVIDGAGVSTDLNYQTTFNPDPTGVDKVYTVILRTNSPCGTATSTPTTITIKSPPPIPALRPSTQLGCSKLLVTFDNLSPGRASNRYIVNFGDGTETTYDYNQAISHEYENSTDDNITFYVNITATNDCSSTSGQEIPIVVLPSQVKAALLLKNPLQTRVCVGSEVIFINNTTGATTYLYEFSNGAPAIPVTTPGVHELPYRFTSPGVVTIKMTATSPCGGTQSVSQTITVDPIPVANFETNIVSGCPGFVVQFKNTSTGAFSYVWDFGDGSQPSRDFEPSHPYTQSGRYTVTLTALNSQGCPATVEKIDFITVTPLPGAEIQVLPGNIIGIPNYTFNFSDLNPPDPAKSYEWSFGDGETSNRRDPAHTYADTGTYWVRLKVKNQYDCESISLPVRVQITGVPGYLFLPNSFIPGGTSVPLQKFTAIGSGIKTWRMQIFNKWGQVIWETTQLDDGKPVEGWDGTYKGTPQPQGIYFWKVDVELINGTEWKGVSYDKKAPKRTGEIYLIR